MPADKVKFKQIAKELQNERIDTALLVITQHLKNEEFREAEEEFGRLIQDLGNLIRVKAVADK